MRFAIGLACSSSRGGRSRGRRIHRTGSRVPGHEVAVDSWAVRGGPVIDIKAIIETNIAFVAVALIAISIILLIATIVLFRRAHRLSTRLASITRGSEERSLEAILEAHLARVHQVVRELEEVVIRTAVLERDFKRAFSRIGLVRYNPFEDTGGNQSFAVALLDDHGDGFVMSSLHARNQTRVYAKGIQAGWSDSAMSTEEEQALRAAMTPPAARSPSG